jgi:aminoglycoside phosphotransferase (APT) family kinase protein
MTRARPGPASDVPGINLHALAQYLPSVLADYDVQRKLVARLLTGGRSNLTYLLSQPGGRKWVLRRPPLGHVMPSAHDMGREYRTLSALSGHRFPAPRARALCTDHSVLGVTFLLYDYTPGLVIATEPAARGLTTVEANRLSQEVITTLAQLHAVHPPAASPNRSASSTQYLRRQLSRWTQQWQRTQTRELSDFIRLTRWLDQTIKNLSNDYPVTWVHGDYRLDNLVLDPSTKQVRAVLDWEMSTGGDPLMDLAVLLVYWEQNGDSLRQHVNVARNLTTQAGFWSRGELLEQYLRLTPHPQDHLIPCLALACLKLAVIMESIHYRHLAGQAVDPLSSGLGDAAPALLQIGMAVTSGHGLAALAM